MRLHERFLQLRGQSMNFKKIILAILISLNIVGMAFSLFLGYEHYMRPVNEIRGSAAGVLAKFSNALCGGGNSIVNCQKVAASSFSEVAGTPIAIYGLIFFILALIIIIFIAVAGKRFRAMLPSVLFWLLAAGALVDIVLLGISMFSIKALCTLCMITYVSLWGMLAVHSVYLKREGIAPWRFVPLRSELASLDGKTKIYTVSMAAIGLFLAVGLSFMTDLMLRSHAGREKARALEEFRDKIVEAFSKEPRSSIPLPENHGQYVLGNPKAPVLIVEFSDFMCPACYAFSKTIDSLVDESPEKVKVVFINLPLDNACNNSIKEQIHNGACDLARGSLCAADQGKFIEYYRLAFRNQYKSIQPGILVELASRSGLDVSAFTQCLASPLTASELKKQIELAEKLQIHSTPTVFINGKQFRYKLEREFIHAVIEEELKQMDRRMFFRNYGK